ncbi:hypothetical protein [Luteibacter rhizovicinus]|uniref:hypothetical protein n=1 Tax=Luteibacter rhizovicinus TaxID=242606 RepID=UPI000F7ABEDD|nr:hypothetical protein [Luteibacter rhizovicinus]
MKNLVDEILHAHGGLDRWRQFKTVEARLVQDGALWGLTLRNPWGHNMHPTHGIHSHDATVEVDLKTVTENGHIQVFDRGAKPVHRNPIFEEVDGRHAPAPDDIRTGDRELDALLDSLGNPDATTMALRDLALSPDGQQFRALGQEQYAEQQVAQENMRQMAAQEPCPPVQHGPVMCR